MISDAKNFFPDKVTKQFFLAARFFSCYKKCFLIARKKSCVRKKILAARKTIALS